jgi:carbon starvation protein
VAETLLATMLVLFAGTTMDSGVRLQRYILQEWGEIYRLPAIKKNVVATLVAVGSCLLIAFGAGGSSGAGGLVIWPLFGSTNQILAGLTLLVISVYLIQLGRPAWATLLPMSFLLVMSLLAGCVLLLGFVSSGNYLLAGINLVVLVATVLVILQAFSVLGRLLAARKSPVEPIATDPERG